MKSGWDDNVFHIGAPIPTKLVDEVFDRSGPCNEAIREAYKKWAKWHGFKERWPGWWERGAEVIHILKGSGVEVIR